MNEFFRAMFCTNFKEACEKEVTINILELLVAYCYTGSIDINEDNAQLIFPQASLMLFPEITEACSVFLKSSINPSNCLSVAKYAQFYNCHALLKSAELHIKEHFEKVALTEEFLKLSEEELKKYLSSDELTVKDEKSVFQAMMRWIDNDLKTRSYTLSKFLPLIRLHHINTNYLLEYVVNTGGCKDYLLPLLDGIKQNLFNAQAMPARTGLKSIKIIIVCTNKIQIYNPKNNEVEFIYNVSSCNSFIPTHYGKQVILVGTDTLQRFDLRTKSCRSITLINGSFNAVTALNNEVYAFSTYNVKTFERWHSQFRRWIEVAKLNYPRINHCTAVLNGKLYAIGGFANDVYLNSVECYDPIKNNWNVCSPMLENRGYARAVIANKEIFVFGGRNDSKSLKCIEKYNPETNTWIKVCDMMMSRQRMGAYFFNKKIYLLGGFDGNAWLTSIEEFDPIRNECKLISPPNITYNEDLYCFPYLCK